MFWHGPTGLHVHLPLIVYEKKIFMQRTRKNHIILPESRQHFLTTLFMELSDFRVWPAMQAVSERVHFP